jgi:flagellar secretion chaperone FliS
MSLQAVRNRYVQDAVSTVSPAKLVTMLYDALVKDLSLAERGLADRDLQVVHDRLLHAQDIVMELQSGLDVTAWDGGPALMSLYTFLHRELIAANVRKDATKIVSVREMVEPLRDAWHQAAATTAA